jgi:multicomponent Na+:H+ antiporter subunit D
VSPAGAWITLPVLLPLAAATVAFLLRPRAAAAVGLVTSLLVLATVVWLCVEVVSGGSERYALAGWEAPLGIELYADGLAAFMLLMAAVVGSASSAYAAGYFARERGTATEGSLRVDRSFWPLWMFLWASLNALFLSADAFNLYVALELLGLSSAALVALGGTREALVAAMRYLLVSLLGSLAYLAGVALLYGSFGTLSLVELGERVSSGPTAWTAIALITLGMALKTALFPLHAWLPPAYASAPAPVSALLSGLGVKASFYLLLRLWFVVFPEALAPAAGQLLGLLGAVAIVWGSVLALRRRGLKMVLAYSSVSQIGYLFLLFSLAADPGSDAWKGGVYLVFSHALAKTAMFMAAGLIATTLGSEELARMDGIAQHLPLTVATFAVAGVTLMGLPPSGGFTAKWLLLGAAIGEGRWLLAVVILAGGLLAAAYLFRFLGRALLNVPAGKVTARPPRGPELVAFALAVASLLLGLLSAPLLALLGVGVGSAG